MSRMTTSRANLSWAMPAMRCACSSGVRAEMLATVETALLDQLRNLRRNELADRLSAGGALPDLSRRDRQGLELEEQHALRTLQLRPHLVQALARIAGTCRNTESCSLEHSLGILPGEEVTELVGADEKQRIAPSLCHKHVDG